ncbi:unnamed protein product, partial [Meganyctiphanes norvegica]
VWAWQQLTWCVFSPAGLVCRWGAGEPPSLEALLGGPPPYVPSGPNTPAHSPQHSRLLPDPLTHPTALLPLTMQHSSTSYTPTKSWPPQFRRMSPSMLRAIEAVRSGKMGFTQAGKTFNVNGRTLWVYYRKLGYEVHNTFRGKRSKPTMGFENLNFDSQAASLVNNSLKQCGGGGGTALFDSQNSLPIMMPPSPSWFDNVAVTLNNNSSNSLMPEAASLGDHLPIQPVLSEPQPPRPHSLPSQSPTSPPHLPSPFPPVSTSTSTSPPLALASIEASTAVDASASVDVAPSSTSPAAITNEAAVLSSASSCHKEAAETSPPLDDHVMEDATRTLQSLLETYNLRNVWTGSVE